MSQIQMGQEMTQEEMQNFQKKWLGTADMKREFWRMLEAHRNQRCAQVESWKEADEAFERMRKLVVATDGGYKKFALDFHGVITRSPEMLSKWAGEIIELGHEVHIMTGSLKNDAFEKELRDHGFHPGKQYTHLYSISSSGMDKGKDITFNDAGDPFLPEKDWNRAKGDYAAQVGITALWDDSPTYGKYFPYTSLYITYSPDNFIEEVQWILDGRTQMGRA